MSAILFAPHADDESLFAFYQLIRTQADVLLVLDPGDQRRAEFAAAMGIAGVPPERWTWNNVDPTDRFWAEAAAELCRLAFLRGYDTIIAPAYEDGGHEHHNAVAKVAEALAPPRLIRYLTYRRGYGRSRGVEVIADKAERDLKLAALQCYQSQWEDPKTAPWFPGGSYGTYQEWVA